MNDLSKWRKVAKWITQTIVVAMELTKNTERMEIYVNVLDSVRQKLIWSAFSRNDGNLFSTSVCVILQCFYKISVKPTVLQKRIVNQLHENSVKSTFFCRQFYSQYGKIFREHSVENQELTAKQIFFVKSFRVKLFSKKLLSRNFFEKWWQ